MGFPDRPWLDHPDEDAFARSANSVFELYSEAVRAAQIPTRHSELRLFCHHDTSRDDVLVMVHPETTEGFESATVSLPPGIAALTPSSRALLVLNVIHAAAMRLGQARGWDAAALTAARAHTLAAGLRYRWDGPPKTSPDRRYVAQPKYVLVDDGYGRVIVQVRRRDDGAPVCASPVVATWGHHSALVRHARTVRWRSKTRVQFLPDDGVSIGPTGTISGSDHEPITVDLTDPTSFGTALEPPAPTYIDVAAASDLPAVTVRTPADLGPRIEVLGGGPMNEIPQVYAQALHALLEQLLGPPWQSWWSDADRTVLQISYDFAAIETGIDVRRSKDTLRATILRPTSTFPMIHDHAATARHDVETMLAAVRRRTGLEDHPHLLTRQTDR
jgi:hypothetical protein